MGNTWFSSLSKGIDSFNLRLCQLISGFTLLMVILMAAIVILRYGFNLGWIAMQESVMYLHACVFMLGAAHTLKADEHVRVDIFYRRMTLRGKALVDLLGCLLLFMPVNLFIFFVSLDYVLDAWRLLEGSPEAGGLPAVFLLKSLILAFAVTMTLQGIAQLLSHLMILTQRQPA